MRCGGELHWESAFRHSGAVNLELLQTGGSSQNRDGGGATAGSRPGNGMAGKGWHIQVDVPAIGLARHAGLATFGSGDTAFMSNNVARGVAEHFFPLARVHAIDEDFDRALGRLLVLNGRGLPPFLDAALVEFGGGIFPRIQIQHQGLARIALLDEGLARSPGVKGLIPRMESMSGAVARVGPRAGVMEVAGGNAWRRSLRART